VVVLGKFLDFFFFHFSVKLFLKILFTKWQKFTTKKFIAPPRSQIKYFSSYMCIRKKTLRLTNVVQVCNLPYLDDGCILIIIICTTKIIHFTKTIIQGYMYRGRLAPQHLPKFESHSLKGNPRVFASR
jgi:hypothetical protein